MRDKTQPTSVITPSLTIKPETIKIALKAKTVGINGIGIIIIKQRIRISIL
jgi:hypothetical protein